MGFIRRFFGLDKIQVLEVQPELALGQEARDSCATLGNHLGFQYLMQQLRRHRAALKQALEICEEKDRVPLQQAVKYSGWLERFVAHEAKLKSAAKREISLSEREQQVLQNSLANISLVE